MSTSRSRSNDNLQAGAQPPRQQPSLLSTDDSVSLMQWRGHPYSSFIPSTSPQERFPAFPSPLNTYALPPLPGHSPRLHSYPSEERHFPFPHELPPIASGSRHSLPVNHRRSQVSHHSPGSSQSSPDSSDMRPYQICRENSVESSTNSRRLDAASSGSEASYASASRSDHQFHFTDVDKLDLGGTASVSTLRPSFTREDSHGVLPGDPSFARASSSAHYIDNLYHGGEVTVRREPRFGHDRRSPTARDVNVIEPSKAGRLPNRDYYPLPHHQSQFDALSVNDASFLQERERLGLNTLDCEPGQPPLHSMPIIIECAILGSPHQKLTLSELRITLKRRFRHYEQEEAKGVKSWERTLLQNLSKKSRFINTERSMSEPGQGGYWQVNHNAPPSNRARKRNIKRLESPLRTGSSVFSPIDPSTYTSHVASIRSEETSTMITTLGGPSSLFRSVPTDSLPRGRMHGMNERCIVLPALRATNAEIFPSSPRRWTVSSSNNIQLQNYPNILSQRNYTGDRGTRLSDDDLTARLALPRRGRDLEPINLPGFNQISTGVRSINERDYHQQRIGNTASQYPLQRT